MINLKDNQKGISLVTLVIAIVIIMIITSTLIYNISTGSDIRALNNMYNDITKLKDKIDLYYATHHTLPIIETDYENINNIKEINPNDNDKYHVIDLEALENLSLTYGKDYETYKASKSNNLIDIYIINEKSHSVYYVKGIKFDEKIYYTQPEESTKVTLPEWSDAYEKTREYVDEDGKKAVIPKGFSVSLGKEENKIIDGLVVKDQKGNEFVWVPAMWTKEGYSRTAFADDNWAYSQAQGDLDEGTNSYIIGRKSNMDYAFVESISEEEKQSVEKYGGYYIGRYEVGIERNEARTADDMGNIEDEIVIKKDKNVYNYISQIEAKEKAESFYNKETDGVISRLCSSYAWDTALNFINLKEENKEWITSGTGGNYKQEVGGTGKLEKTGYHNINNIYDMAGNVYEWTTEDYYGNDTEASNRGGYYGSDLVNGKLASPAALRSYNDKTYRAIGNGFRITVFIPVE